MPRESKDSNKDLVTKIILDIEKKSIQKLPFDTIKIAQKAKVDIGTRCNAECHFCYYKDSLDADIKETQKIKNEIKELVQVGFTKIELSGGEPTIHPDFIKILEYITELGAEPSFLTNAIEINPKMMQDIYQAGVRDILISVQGLPKQHDKILGHQGAFLHILEVLDWMKHLNMQARINTVVTTNQKDLPKLWEILKDKINVWNLLPLNHWDAANKLKRLPYNEHAEMFNYILGNRNVYEPKIYVRYFPICFIHPQHREYIKTYWDHYSDELDWHPFFMDSNDITQKKLSAYKNKDTDFYKQNLLQKRTQFFIKDKECLTCEMFKECDGFKK